MTAAAAARHPSPSFCTMVLAVMGAFCCPSVGQSIDEGRAEGRGGMQYPSDGHYYVVGNGHHISWLRAQKEGCSFLETDTINGTHLVTFS